MKLIIPMAGRGTRVRPHSHVTPKPLLPVCGKSMVERIIDTFSESLPKPLTEGIFVLGPDFGQGVRNMLDDICDRHDMHSHFVVQEEALGTAHAVACAADHLTGEGIVVFADTLFYMDPGVDLTDADVVAWVKHIEDPSRFGVAVREGDKIVELVEKPTTLVSTEVLIGIYYVRDLSLLQGAIEYLFDHNLTGFSDEYQLTDAFDRMLKDGRIFKTAGVTAWLDCGTIDALLETTIDILSRENIPVPEGAAVDSVIIEPVFVAEGARIERSIVGPNVSLESGAVVRDSIVSDSIIFSDGEVVGANLKNSLIGRSATVKGTSSTLNIGDHGSLATGA